MEKLPTESPNNWPTGTKILLCNLAQKTYVNRKIRYCTPVIKNTYFIKTTNGETWHLHNKPVPQFPVLRDTKENRLECFLRDIPIKDEEDEDN